MIPHPFSAACNSQPTMSYLLHLHADRLELGYWRQMCTETDRPVGGEFIVYPGAHKQEGGIPLCRDMKPCHPSTAPAPQAQRERAAAAVAAGAAHRGAALARRRPPSRALAAPRPPRSRTGDDGAADTVSTQPPHAADETCMDYTQLATLRSSADAEVAAELIGEFGEIDPGNTKGALTGYRNDVNTYDSQVYPATGWHWIVSWMRDGDGRAPQGATGIRYSDYIYADPAHPYFSYQPPWKPGHPKTGSWPAYYHLTGLYDDGKIQSYPDTHWWPGQNCLCERARARPSCAAVSPSPLAAVDTAAAWGAAARLGDRCTAIIAGAAGGGGAVLLLSIVLSVVIVWCCCCKGKKAAAAPLPPPSRARRWGTAKHLSCERSENLLQRSCARSSRAPHGE